VAYSNAGVTRGGIESRVVRTAAAIVLGLIAVGVGSTLSERARTTTLHRADGAADLRKAEHAGPASSTDSDQVEAQPQRPPTPNDSARYSPLAEITRENVGSLRVAWTYHTRDFSGGSPEPTGSVPSVQTRPVFANGLIYVTTPSAIVIALDGDTGREVWRHDPQAGAAQRCYEAHRGVAFMAANGGEGATVFSGTCDGRLVALDAATGRLRTGMGSGGVLDLRPGVDARPGERYAVTSPPAIWRDLVIVGAYVPEEVPQGPVGDVRAFDARTGQERWRFHTVPRPGEFGHDTWPDEGWQRRTGVNAWSSMSVDAERGLVFVPLGSPSYDFYGGDRQGANLFGNSLVALEAATGRRVWHQQLVHHDLWDFDPPAQPILADVQHEGQTVPAVIQLTKMGLVFVFNRLTGEPVFGVDERPVPSSDVPGEHAWPTQPFPRKPAPLARTTPITRGDLTTVTPESRRECEALFAEVQTGGLFTPPGRQLTLTFPGTLGGATWSGGAVDPATSYLIVNTNEVGAIGQMVAKAGAVLPFARSSPRGAYARFWDSQELPCQQPPWGRLHAVDLSSGAIVWQVPLGNEPALAARGITGTGTPNLGGAIVTAGGVVFIGATNDRAFRAFDVRTGHELWKADLPASGHGFPLSYRDKSGRQLVVIAAGGGGRFSHTISDAIVAFALPR
jgi:glucose dehydrogenase